VLLLSMLALTGCSSYQIQGRVIRGPVAAVTIVDGDDPRLSEPNMTGGGATIQATLQPDTPTETMDLGTHTTDGQGRFSIPVNAFGSGFLEYEAQLVGRREGNQGAMATIDLPRRGQRVLITLPMGRDTLIVPERFRDSALRDAAPYLEENR